MSHPSREELAAFAIGGLDPVEEKVVAEHTEVCEVCSAEMLHLAPAVGVLAESVDQVEPPPELRERLLTIVRDEAVSGVPQPTRAKRARFTFSSLVMRPATGLAVAALLAAGVGGYLAADGGTGGDTRTVPITEAAGDASGELILADGNATLMMEGMPQLSQGSVYQVWVADPSGAVEPSSTFLPQSDGTATAAIPEAGSDDAERVLVTAEPGPNRTDPTEPAILDVGL